MNAYESSNENESSFYSNTKSKLPSTLSKISNFQRYCSEIFEEINFVRTKPDQYIARLNNYKKFLISNDLLIPNKQPINLVEGESCLDDLIDYIRYSNSNYFLSREEVLDNVAQELIELRCRNDGVQINYSDDDFFNRLKKYGQPLGIAGECIDIGSWDSEMLILKLLLDDGHEERANRQLLFNDQINFVGISVGYLPSSEKFITVLDFCEDYYLKSEKVRNRTHKGQKTNSSKNCPVINLNNVKPKMFGFMKTPTELDQETKKEITEQMKNASPTSLVSLTGRQIQNSEHKKCESIQLAKNSRTNLINLQYLTANGTRKQAHTSENLSPETHEQRLRNQIEQIKIANTEPEYVTYKIKNENLKVKAKNHKLTSKTQLEQISDSTMKGPKSTSITYAEKEIEDNSQIDSIHISRKYMVERGVRKRLVTKTVYYIDGSSDEWISKE